jgi:DNA mismatch repair protein MutL
VINSCPADIIYNEPKEIIENFINEYKLTKNDIKIKARDKLAVSLAKAAAINYGKKLTNEEMREIIDQLFACEYPNYSPSGKNIVTILSIEEIDKRF